MSKEMDAQIEELVTKNRRLSAELEAKGLMFNRALASYQELAMQMEALRQQNQDLERMAAEHAGTQPVPGCQQRARQKDAIVARSDEVLTALNFILSYCDLLMREEGSRLTAHGRRDLEMIQLNAKSAISIVSQGVANDENGSGPSTDDVGVRP